MPGLDFANLLVAFQIVYVKVLCALTTVCLGPWSGIQIYLYSQHPPGMLKFIKVMKTSVKNIMFKQSCIFEICELITVSKFLHRYVKLGCRNDESSDDEDTRKKLFVLISTILCCR